MQTWMVVATFDETMQCYHPLERQLLIARGQWEDLKGEVQRRAEEIISTHVATSTRNHPLPLDYEDRVATLRTLHMEGRELAIDELVSFLVPPEPPEDREQDESDDDFEVG